MIGTRHAVLLAALVLLAAASIAIALVVGSVAIHPLAVLDALRDSAGGLDADIVRELRLPRAVNAFATGGLLAVAGVLMQVLVRNPLADPYVLGISGGAAVGALGAILVGAAGLLVPGAAFVGAAASTALVLALGRAGGAWMPTRLLLVGVIVAAGWGAVVTFMLAVAPDQRLRGMLFWLMGDLSHASGGGIALGALAVGAAAALVLARKLNLLAHGDDRAAILGVEVAPTRLAVFLLASALTAAAVTTAGTVGFIGLVVPHLVRLASGEDHRVLVPGAALLGGALLVLADTLARTLLAPQQLPVGVVTALVGVPLFLVLLARRSR
ncbi:MAG TPA: iron ABC transporter permease [Burkholderiales bacterium]|nr:iron ABC transporter permease [Burkholderiales bacterium]